MFGYITTKNLYICELKDFNGNITYVLTRRITDYVYRDFYTDEYYYYKQVFMDDSDKYVNFSLPLFVNKNFAKKEEIQEILKRYNNQSKKLRRTK